MSHNVTEITKSQLQRKQTDARAAVSAEVVVVAVVIVVQLVALLAVPTNADIPELSSPTCACVRRPKTDSNA